jgi:2-keto-4-pentenoate hydratase/2-oxohepta-3-ene-1,7-dioic acid hydratase in catechol pathway
LRERVGDARQTWLAEPLSRVASAGFEGGVPPAEAIALRTLPAAAPDQVDYEAELAVVIGKAARRVSEADALEYVLGYTCGNDVSARDAQWKLDKQWARAKSCDTFCPLGPCLVTGIDPDSLKIQTRLNGNTMQESNTHDLIFNVPKLVSYVSHNKTLRPGDIIMTGTPEGVGVARTPQVFLKPGNTIEVEIDNIGVLRNPVRAEHV